jgi:predicted DCC family thiol-disulfide oxidoreductase YuxK
VDRTVVWDDQCRFCAASVKTLQLLDWFGALRFEGSSDPATLARYGIAPEQAAEGLQYLDSSGRRSSYDAVVAALAATPLGFPISLAMRLPPVRWLGSRVYRWVARNRRCILPLPV